MKQKGSHLNWNEGNLAFYLKFKEDTVVGSRFFGDIWWNKNPSLISSNQAFQVDLPGPDRFLYQVLLLLLPCMRYGSLIYP
ncbi:hypothetical protein HK099_005639 [Clydaea vesicula]|uniref:Uncharacterized protein n=1 Tax=Clydaea vesicula TaxID=447962 RepID=A0AAD5U9B0_9FUNG|nr:hypothetical protein HK099_005639 [Clydaea vesicula]